MFKHAEVLKLRALYVDLRKHGKVLIPNDAVQSATVKRVHKFLTNIVQGFDAILDENDENFRKTAEYIDPGRHYVLGPMERKKRKSAMHETKSLGKPNSREMSTTE